jgi:hypothetical protein
LNYFWNSGKFFKKKFQEKFLKISSPFFFTLKFVLRLFKHIVFRKQESFSNLKKAKRTFFLFLSTFKYPKNLSYLSGGLVYILGRFKFSSQNLLWFEKIQPTAKFFRCPKNKTKKEVKKYGLGIISCITSNI